MYKLALLPPKLHRGNREGPDGCWAHCELHYGGGTMNLGNLVF